MLNFEQTPLTAAEARVLATLMEKARTVPDSYPLTLNSLQSGCNQKSSREPVMNLIEDEIAQAIDGLRERSLVFESSGGRTARYEHNFERAVGLPSQAAALLGLLLLRGPQTAGELRLNAERWHRFADIGSVEVFLEELQQRSPEKGGPLVVKLERAPGAREQRWAQLLCGPVDLQAAAASAGASAPTGKHASAELQALAERVTALEALVAELQQRLEAAGA
ncbi:YceH family protein [Malikia spinosa]|uniref:YceH family protein n=1 Tax=Malikia spinosa TaxID=86180 RepID=UPI000A677C90